MAAQRRPPVSRAGKPPAGAGKPGAGKPGEGKKILGMDRRVAIVGGLALLGGVIYIVWRNHQLNASGTGTTSTTGTTDTAGLQGAAMQGATGTETLVIKVRQMGGGGGGGKGGGGHKHHKKPPPPPKHHHHPGPKPRRPHVPPPWRPGPKPPHPVPPVVRR